MINTLKDLEKLFALCQKRGVTELKLDNIELKIDRTSSHTAKGPKRVLVSEEALFDPGRIPPGVPLPTSEVIASDMPSEEEMLFYSAVPHGEEAN